MKLSLPTKNHRGVIWALALCVVAYTVVFSWFSIRKYAGFNFGSDFASMLQAFYNSLHGHWMEITVPEKGINLCRLSGHVELIYFLLLPVFAAFPHPYTLLILQSLVLAMGGVAVYLIAREASGHRGAAFALALSYWFFPYLANINLSDFHADAFIILPHLLAWYFLRKGRMNGFWICIALGMGCKEYACLFNFLLGVLVIRERRREGVILGCLALFQFFLLTPAINALAGAHALALQTEAHAFPQSGGDFLVHLRDKVFTEEYAINTASLVILLWPAWMFYRRGLVLVIPLYAGLSVTNLWGLFSTHRHALLVAPIFICLAEGLRRIPERRRYASALFGCALPAMAMTFFYPGSLLAQNVAEITYKHQYRNPFHYRYTPHDHLADSLLSAIPAGEPVAADVGLRNKLCNRRFLFVHPFPAQVEKADYYLFDFFESLEYCCQEARRKRASQILSSSDFTLNSFVDGILIVKRTPHSDFVRPFSLQRVSDTGARGFDPPLEILSRRIEPTPGGYLSHTVFHIGSKLRGQALISFFEGERDTLKVLHLPTYLSVDLGTLGVGTYSEEFFFQIPAGKSLAGRRHRIELFAKDSYLPFFARASFRLGEY